MPTNRPFFTNFLAAFRAHSALTASKTSTSPPSVTTAPTTSQFTLPSTSSAARTITTATSTPATQPTPQNPSPTPPNAPSSHLKASTASPPLSTSAANPLSAAAAAAAATAGPLSHRARQTSTSPPPPRSPTQTPFTRVPQRRGSDSSSEGGFREVLGGEKWYIGGRTAAGEERFYRMGIVRRERSWEGRSFDRLSL
ncbi:MAG: hypothetical protein LQ349_001493 [Xanthoria aureola]|nr:MAG: hypothetical protein LQ349_001493 [Xanthoria aureola]